jgi:hypothetical protein
VIDVHPDLLCDATRPRVLGADERDQVVHLQVRERPVPRGGGRLVGDALPLAAGLGVPADLDVLDALEQHRRRAGRAEELARSAILDDPQAEPPLPILLEPPIQPRPGLLEIERRRVPAHVLGIGEHREEVIEVVGPVRAQAQALGLEEEVRVHGAER